MASDRPGYFTRLKNSVFGFLFGLALFLLAIPFLAWNENNVYKVRQGLKEGAKIVQTVSAQPESSRDQQLLHIQGEVTTANGVSDPVFGLEYDMLRLSRKVEMYQWDEDKKTRDGKTQYSYDQEWSERHKDSSQFHTAGYENPPPPPYSSEDFIASDARLGGYRIETSQLRAAGGMGDLSNAELPSRLISQGWSGGHGNTWFRGRGSLSAPQVGDVRVSFKALAEGPMSLVGMQQGDRLQPWVSSRKTEVMLVERGTQPAALMFENAQSRNSTLGWALRAAGFGAMWMGLSLCLGPLSAVISFIPGLSGIVSRVGGVVAFIIAAIFAVTTVVLSWIIVRPLALMAIVGGIVAIALVFGRLRGAKQELAASPPPPPSSAAPPPPPPPPPPQ